MITKKQYKTAILISLGIGAFFSIEVLGYALLQWVVIWFASSVDPGSFSGNELANIAFETIISLNVLMLISIVLFLIIILFFKLKNKKKGSDLKIW